MPGPATSGQATPVDVGRLLDDGRWTPYQQRLVGLTALAIIFDGADNQLLGTAVPAMMREWQLARAAFAPVLALGFIGMMIGGAVAGLAGDRLGRKAALVGSVLLFGFATAAAGAVDGIAGLAATRLLAGVGLGGALPNAAALASEFVPRRHRAIAVTLTIVCVPLGGTLAGFLALRVLPALGWRVLFVVGGVIPIAAAAVLMLTLAESPAYLLARPIRRGELVALLRRMGHAVPDGARLAEPAAAARASIGALLTPDRRADTVALWIAFISCLLAVYLGFNWVPSMLTGAGLSPETGSTGIMMFNLGGVAGAIGGALLFPRLGSRLTMLALVAGAVVSAAALASIRIDAATSTMTVVALLCVTGGFINAVQSTMYALAAQMYPTAIRATGVGSAVAIGRTGAILSSYAGAWVLDAGGPRTFFVAVGAAMVAAGLALAVIRRHIPPASNAVTG
jgi:AAHS family 4-hydroxybenzoate transporter-like MFS transporter